MSLSFIPSCYFPSTVVFVDNNQEFLHAFIPKLPSNLPYRLFDSPYDAIEVIYAKQAHAKHFNEYCLSEEIESTKCPLTNHTINIDLSAMHFEIYNPARFSEVSVVVIDYAMPGMNGLEFCQRLQDSPTKKILLVDQAEENAAIEALNQGVIHRFIAKNTVDIKEKIITGIHQLQQRYFQDMSEIIIKMLATHSPSCLQDKKFSTFFHALIEKYKIVEYYLTDRSGSYLMFDENAHARYLIMKKEDDLKLHYDMALDHHAPQEILAQIKSGEKIPYFWNPNTLIPEEWTDWSTYLIPAKKLQFNDELYYYAVDEKPIMLRLHPEKVISFADYLKQNHPQQNKTHLSQLIYSRHQ